MRVCNFILILLAVCFSYTGYSQSFPNLQFEHITIKEGLSSNVTTCVTEDKNGFIWVGTNNGLNRYDGYRFKAYYHKDDDSNSLINNSIQRLYCDSKNRIWISTVDGLSCFYPDENKFINYSTRFANPYQLENNNSVGIYEDAKRDIYITNQGDYIYKIDKSNKLEKIKLGGKTFYGGSVPINGYGIIKRDNFGNEWAIMSKRIYLLNVKTKLVTVTYDFENVSPNLDILNLIHDSNNNYWVSTYMNGIYQFLPEEKQLKKLTSSTNQISYNLTEWNYKKHKWLLCTGSATDSYGLFLFNTDNNTSYNYRHIESDPLSFNGIYSNNLFVDSKDNLWLTTEEGLQKVNAEEKIIDIIPVTEKGSTNFSIQHNGNISSFFENNNSIWLAKLYSSTLRYDTGFNLENTFLSLYPLSEVNFHKPTALSYSFWQKEKELYISTDSGLVIYNLQDKTTQLYFPPQCKGYANLRTIIPFKENEILIRSRRQGLFVFNTLQKKYTDWYSNTDSCVNCLPLLTNFILKTKAGKIVVSTFPKGLMVYNEQTGNFNPQVPGNNKDFELSKNLLAGMAEDTEGKIWITSNNGVFVYNPATNLIEKHFNENGQIGTCSKICFDKKGNTWIAATSGIWCYIKNKEKWIKFSAEDGLIGNDFENMIACRNNGDIVAGLRSAVAVFHPNKLEGQNDKFAVVITEGLVANRQIAFPLNNNSGKRLEIEPDQNSFSVEFALLDYLHPQASRYYYKLEPLIKEYQLNSDGHINFNGLSPGRYTLHARGGDKLGNMYDNEDILTIIVNPHWYQTNLFRVLCAALIGILIFYFVRRRIATVRKESALKQKITETEIAALKAQMNPHFIFNCINSIDALIQSNDKYNATNYLNKFAKLIRNVLDSSKENVVPFSKDVETLQLYIELEKLRSENKFTSSITISEELLNSDYKVPPLIIQPFVENAIHHGLRNKEGNDGILNIAIKRVDDKINYTVTDNGIGRAAAAKISSSQHQSYGMQMSYDRIKMFNNEETPSVKIDDLYENNLPAGTKVTVQLKIK